MLLVISKFWRKNIMISEFGAKNSEEWNDAFHWVYSGPSFTDYPFFGLKFTDCRISSLNFTSYQFLGQI